MDKYVQQIREFLRGLNAGQRMLLAGSVVLVTLVIYVFVRLFAAADYSPLYAGLDPADAQKIVQQLTVEDISYQLSSDGTALSVPADKLDRVRVEMASQSLPHTGRMGFELFDKPNWSSSDFSERVNYQRALEAELERTIESMDTVESARVHLVLPHESIFSADDRPAKAAVVVKLRTQKDADQTAMAIANLVASAWENLSPDDVTIVGADGRLPLVASRAGSAAGPRGLNDAETALAERIVDTLAPVVGADHVKSSVTIEYSANSGESTQELYDPNATAVLSSQLSQDQSSGGAPAMGIPGTASNVPSAPAAAAAGAAPPKPGTPAPPATTAPAGTATPPTALAEGNEGTYGMRSESKTFAVSKTVKHSIEPAGQIKRLSVAVLIDDATDVGEVNGKRTETRRVRKADEMKQIQELVQAAVGFDATRGDEVSVQNISFQTPPEETVPIPTRVQRTLRAVQPWIGMLRYVGVGLLFSLVYLLLLRPVKKQVLQTLRALPSAQASKVAGTLPGQSALAAATGSITVAQIEGELERELAQTNSEVMRAVVLKRHLVSKVKKEPEAASRLVQTWIRQDSTQT